jgi:cyanamide hydratase
MSSTHMSFDFQGGFIALAKLQELGAPKMQAESVAEAIIRHQDPGETGTISAMGQLIQVATEFGMYKYYCCFRTFFSFC